MVFRPGLLILRPRTYIPKLERFQMHVILGHAKETPGEL